MQIKYEKNANFEEKRGSCSALGRNLISAYNAGLIKERG